MPWKDILTLAVHIQDHSTAAKLLSEGQSPDGRTDGYEPLLHKAVGNNDLRMTKLLLDHGAEVNKQDSMYQTALLQSTSPDVDIEISKTLIEAGGVINIKDMYERTPLHYLSFYPQEEKITHFLHTPSSELLNAVDYFGNTALHLCTTPDQRHETGGLLVMEKLLTAGADPNIQDKRGKSSLHHVSTHNEPKIELFISKTKDINYLLPDSEGENFMHNLIANPSLMQSYLINLLESPLIPEPVWKALLNSRNIYGLSPFSSFFGAFICNENIVRKMIELGADVNGPDGVDVTPLMKSSTFSLDVVETLIEYDANPNAQDIAGGTALHLAMNSEIVLLLIDAGSSINLCDKWGCSPLQQSFPCDQDLLAETDVQTTLTIQGSDINHKDIYGATALHHAACSSSDLTSMLLKMGADKRIKDKSGRTPLDVACLLGNWEVENILRANKSISPSDEKLLTYPEDITGENLQKCLQNLELVKAVEKACDNLLQEGGIFNDFHTANENIRIGVNDLMDDIAKKMGEQDEHFSIQIYTSGSSSEGTKAGLYNEFDFVFCLPFFADLCEIVEERSDAFTGLARLRCKDLLPPRVVSHLFDDEGFLLSHELRKTCDSLIRRVILNRDIWKRDNVKMGSLATSFKTNDTEKPVSNFTISWIDELHKNLGISIDVAFGIHKAGWWPHGVSTETIAQMTDEVTPFGCLLLVQVPGHMRWIGQHFRISCSLMESRMMVQLSQDIKNSYKLAKILKDDLCPGIDFGDDEDGSPSIASSASDVISSYMLKNCLFHVITNTSSASFSQSNKNKLTRRCIIHNTAEIYRCLMRAATEQSLPCHFLPKVDIFRYQIVNIEGFEDNSDDVLLSLKQNTNEIASYCKVILGCLGIANF
ncbi:uncharacterized protein LOC132552149 [Ylistrum balloti]|uniref:uncharacterized protein LOC132552149 n=1 Tax=Ylistrum balloti TaxID=509963 RepID=UPI002905B544|nr:uncharacterized protein LOC132552149 [Ylistrum balloti]